jgi:CheY-like chemotaxis protein
MCVITDVTDIKQRETNLIESNRALRAATEAKSEFLANMSHEIRTPLNGVIGITELLLDSNLSDEQREYLNLLQSSAENLVTIISDILDFSKVEAGKLDIENVSFDLEGILGEVHRTLEISAKEKGLMLSRSFSGEMNTKYLGDPGRVKQVLTNLVNNAIKFTSSGLVSTAVTTKALENNHTEVRVEVSDTGVGISAETLSRLFSPFTQADNSTTRKFGGTGLGLSISKRLVELMGGQVGVESEVGKGSKFWFSLVLENAPSESVKKIEWASTPIDVSRQSMKILVAEDNALNERITIEMLARLGLQADTVQNGKAAIQALQEKHYDLVLMDCHMPEMDGYEASNLIRSSALGQKGDVTIIALTANAMKGDREKCLAAGMDDYVTKPVKIEELEKAISRSMKKTTGQA